MLMTAGDRFSADSFFETEGWEPERFYYVAGSAWMAIAVVNAKEETPEMIAGIDGAIEEVRANSELTAEEKEEMIAEFEEMKALFLGIDTYVDVDPDELALVEARKDEVRAVLDIE
jgi:hypothetical protein